MIRELDIYGRVRMEEAETNFVPFLFQGQYNDHETGLAYNRFRYYAPEWGMYISQDPIRLEAGLTNPYAYVHDTNGWIDPLGLAKTLTLRAAFRRAKQQLRILKKCKYPYSY
jgi:rhs family protein